MNSHFKNVKALENTFLFPFLLSLLLESERQEGTLAFKGGCKNPSSTKAAGTLQLEEDFRAAGNRGIRAIMGVLWLARFMLGCTAVLYVEQAQGQYEGDLQTDRFAGYEERQPANRVRRRGQDTLRGYV